MLYDAGLEETVQHELFMLGDNEIEGEVMKNHV